MLHVCACVQCDLVVVKDDAGVPLYLHCIAHRTKLQLGTVDPAGSQDPLSAGGVAVGGPTMGANPAAVRPGTVARAASGAGTGASGSQQGPGHRDGRLSHGGPAMDAPEAAARLHVHGPGARHAVAAPSAAGRLDGAVELGSAAQASRSPGSAWVLDWAPDDHPGHQSLYSGLFDQPRMHYKVRHSRAQCSNLPRCMMHGVWRRLLRRL
jgi:hypothetical protein